MTDGQVVGKSTIGGDVTAKLIASRDGACRGAMAGDDREQALWLFSPSACGRLRFCRPEDRSCRQARSSRPDHSGVGQECACARRQRLVAQGDDIRWKVHPAFVLAVGAVAGTAAILP